MLESDVGEVSMMNARGELLFKAYTTYSMLTLLTGFDGGSLNETSIWVIGPTHGQHCQDVVFLQSFGINCEMLSCSHVCSHCHLQINATSCQTCLAFGKWNLIRFGLPTICL
jgi:hypothetical protein